MITTVDNRALTIPNGALSNSAVFNANAMPERRLDLSVGISYDSDLRKAKEVMEQVKYVQEKRSFRVPTGQLNSLVSDAMMMNPPPSDKGKRLKIYYSSQVGTKPPLFSFSINKRDLMHFSYARYLENRIRDAFGFEGTSIKFVFREKGDKKE